MPGDMQSEQYALWHRLINRFRLVLSAGAEKAYIHTDVQPITDADKLLRRYGMDSINLASINGTGENTAALVPKGERWTVHQISIARQSGDRQITTLLVRPSAHNGIQRTGAAVGYQNLVVQAAAADIEFAQGTLQYPIVLLEGWSIAFVVAGGTAGTIWAVALTYEVEDAY